MLNQRKIALDKVNEMFGTNITVELSSSWEDNQIELELEQENISEVSDNADSDTNVSELDN